MEHSLVEKVHTVIRFDGPALEGKSMDVAHLAPAMLALSNLIRETNAYANGDRAGIKVFVNADLEQKCFELNIELAQTIWEQAKLLVADDNVVAAKEIAEWLGILGAPVVGVFGLYQLIKKIRGRTITSVTVLRVSEGRDLVEIKIEDDGEPLLVSRAVYELYANLSIRQKAVDVLAPLREEGYENLKFYEGDTTYAAFASEEVPKVDSSDLPEVIPQNVHISNIRTGVRIRRAVYEGKSMWTLVYKRAIDARIDDEEWLESFQRGSVSAPPGSALDVILEESYVTNEGGEILGEASYRVTKVHGVELPREQTSLEFRDVRGPINQEGGPVVTSKPPRTPC